MMISGTLYRTEDINPDTGYRRGSIEDSFMRIVNAGDEQRALDMLQSMLERMAAFEADPC